MHPHITVLTLAVENLERAVAFYRDGLGLATEGIVGQEFEHGAVAFFDLAGGLRLALWARDDLAHDSGLAAGSGPGLWGSIGHNVRSREAVDAVMREAEAAGATIVKAPHETFWGGYSGYFQDLDGHAWEVVWNPNLLPAE
jgi:catechol 2,3-dioxygenase-like lactoylglutathione lyase family enzyme